VAAVVHRWVDPLAAAPGAQPEYWACRRNRAPHTPECSQRPRVCRSAPPPPRSSRCCCGRRMILPESLIAPFTGSRLALASSRPDRYSLRRSDRSGQPTPVAGRSQSLQLRAVPGGPPPRPGMLAHLAKRPISSCTGWGLRANSPESCTEVGRDTIEGCHATR
jgi:hypothetical protein